MNFRADSLLPLSAEVFFLIIFFISQSAAGVMASQHSVPSGAKKNKQKKHGHGPSIIVYAISHRTCGGAREKAPGSETGYEINGGTGSRRGVCLHAASKSSELARMNDRFSASAVLLNQYCNSHPPPPPPPSVLSVRRDS